jgi:hypothetical protein
VDATRYRDEVHPDHIVMLDAYCLRLMEQGDMTPKEMSLWVGFRQAVWRQWKIGQGTVRNIPHWKAMEFAMMSRASYFRELSGKTAAAATSNSCRRPSRPERRRDGQRQPIPAGWPA